MKESCNFGYSNFRLELRGANNLCAVFAKAMPQTGESAEDVFNEQSLADRVAKLEEQGVDASFSRRALDALRRSKRDLN